MEKLDDVINLEINDHSRLSEFNQLVYPVVSRRSKGLSLGVNLNPDKKCNFGCVYCQVDRTVPQINLKPGVEQVIGELRNWLEKIAQNNFTYRGYPLKDIAFAGDGDPCMVKIFPEILKEVIKLKHEFSLDNCKIVIFTNGIKLDRPDIQAVLPDFFANQGDIWIKMDSWNQDLLQKVNGSRYNFDDLIQKVINTARKFPLILQSCFFQWSQEEFSPDNYDSYIELVQKMINTGAKFKLIQAYTLARKPADQRATPWNDQQMLILKDYLQNQLPVNVEVYFEKGTSQ